MGNSSFFGQGQTTPERQIAGPGTPTTRRASAGTGTFVGDTHLASGSVVDNTLRLVLNNGAEVDVPLGAINAPSGINFNSSNRQLTLNLSSGTSISTTVPGQGIAYATGNSYNLGDLVTFQTTLFICIIADPNSQTNPSASSNWMEVMTGGGGASSILYSATQ